MVSDQITIVVRGGGDIATGSIYRLSKAGFSIVVLEIEKPRVVRRAVAAAQCVFVGQHAVEGVAFQKVDIDGIKSKSPANILVDARMLKRNIDSSCDLADLTVGLGPGFTVGDNCDVVIETQRGYNLGRVYSDQGSSAMPDTGYPEQVNGYSYERVLRAPCSGIVQAQAAIGDMILEGVIVASVGNREVLAPFPGVLRGLIQTGLKVDEYDKIGDIDPRAIRSHCFKISDKALAIGGGVLEAVMTWVSSTRL